MVLTLSFLIAAAGSFYAMAAKSYVVKYVTTTHIAELLGAGDARRDAIECFVNGARNIPETTQ